MFGQASPMAAPAEQAPLPRMIAPHAETNSWTRDAGAEVTSAPGREFVRIHRNALYGQYLHS